MIRAQSYSPADLTQAVAEGRLSFEDQRLTEMLWRMRLRNWPETLTPEEKKARRAFVPKDFPVKFRGCAALRLL